ncbi:hypothetical protein OAE57_02070 [Synechococcus sp. AH-551-C10]|nr:hypothetical protein [Synechococcus sp. AH-551-C10]MDB4659838.1 hypothetical protein [Synechococcus sp. AH-551-C10]
MRIRQLLASLLLPTQLLGFLSLSTPARADSWKDVEDLIELVKRTGTKVQKTDQCDGNTLGYYQPPRKDGSGDRLVFCTNNLDMEDVSALWEVLSHESAHVMQACNRGLIWKAEFHPRMLRNLKNIAPHYYQILQNYRGGDKMIELEAFDMELKTASEVKNLFIDICSSDDNSNSNPSQQEGESAGTTQGDLNSILAIVGGEASFKALMTWASQNLTAEQLGDLKQILQSGDIAKIKELLLALQKAFNDSKSYENYRLF